MPPLYIPELQFESDSAGCRQPVLGKERIMAIPMPIVQDIRRLDRQGLSRVQIARLLHVDRGTVAKYADMEDCAEDATDDGIDAMGNPSAGTIVYAGPLEDGLTDERLSDLFGMPIEVQHTHGRWSAYAV